MLDVRRFRGDFRLKPLPFDEIFRQILVAIVHLVGRNVLRVDERYVH